MSRLEQQRFTISEVAADWYELMIPCYWRVVGRQTAHDIAAFAKESSQNAVRVLGPTDFPGVASSQQPWFIDFYAPVRTLILHSTMTATNHDNQLGEIYPTMLNELNCTKTVLYPDVLLCMGFEPATE